jgi:RND superfamily putative drug exporter
MIAVFLGFAQSDVTPLKQLGVGLAFAVLIDATLIRGVLVPASMQLLGRWNWWFPTLGRSHRTRRRPRHGPAGKTPTEFDRRQRALVIATPGQSDLTPHER